MTARRITERLAVLLFVAAWAVPSAGQTWRTESGRAEFDSRVPLHSFTGTSESLVGRVSLADSTVDFYLDLETLETGIGKRDKDMRKTLETDAFPFAEFFGRLAAPFDPLADEQDVTVVGDFTIHGITRRIEVDGTIASHPEGLRIRAAWSLNLEDYGIKPPSLLIMKVDPVQQLRIDAVFTPETEEGS